MTCKEFEELSGAFVLGAVTEEEREAARLHIVQCVACARLYQELRSVVSLLPLSVPEMDPPATLEARVLKAIRREAKITAQTTQRVPFANLQHNRNRRSRKNSSWATRLLAVAAVLLLTLLGGMSLLLYSLEHQVAISEQQAITIGQQLANVELQLANVSPHPLATITGTSVLQGATGNLFYLPQQNATLLVMHGLPQLAGTHVYQGWLLDIQGEKITSIKSVGLLTMQGDTAIVSFPGNVTSYNTAVISREPGPAPSLKAPAGPVVALGPLKN